MAATRPSRTPRRKSQRPPVSAAHGQKQYKSPIRRKKAKKTSASY